MTDKKMATATVLIIGSGRLARHLIHWFSLEAHHSKLLTWDRHQNPHAIHKYVLQATHVWLAITDSAIVPFYEKYISGHDITAVHFSGALHDERIISAHPMMTFSDQLYEDTFYSQIYFGLTGYSNLSDEILSPLPGFKNAFYIVEPESKPLYHALCVVAGNFPQMLWSEVSNLAAKQKIPQAALNIYIQKITENFLLYGPQALTGPFVRQDILTIDKNIQSLSGTLLEKIYTSFKKVFLK